MEVGILLNFFKDYGLHLGLLALSGMFILGFLKKVGVFKKLNEKYKKYVYFWSSSILSIIACSIYIFATHSFSWIPYLSMCGAVCAVTIVGYSFYEHTPLRKWFNKILDLLWVGVKKLFVLIFVHKLDANTIKSKMVKWGSEKSEELLKDLQVAVEEIKQAEKTKTETTKEPQKTENGSV